MSKIYFLFSMLLVCSLSAQDEEALPLAIGEWKSHLPYKYAISVTQSDEYLFYATPFSILRIDKEDGAQRRISKVEGLSQVNINRLAYNRASETLIVAYEDSTIDLVREDGITALSDIKNFSAILSEKVIENIRINSDNTVLLVGNFGLTELRLDDATFTFTTFTGIDVLDVANYRDHVYLVTEEGIYVTPRSNNRIEDFTTWDFFDADGALPGDYSARAIGVWEDELYFEVNGSVLRYDGTAVDTVFAGHPLQVARYISTEGSRLVIGLGCSSYQDTDCDALILYSDADGNLTENSSFCIARPRAAAPDTQGRIWLADQFQGFRLIEAGGDCRSFDVNSPFSHKVSDILIQEDTVWVAAGGAQLDGQNLFNQEGIYRLANEEWTNFRIANTSEFNPPTGRLFDLWKFASDPETNRVWVASNLEGLVEFKDGKIQTVYNEFNSSLTDDPANPGRIRVGGLHFDENTGNLWVTNYLVEEALHVLRPDGTWKAFNPPGTQSQLQDIVIDPNGYLWMTTPSENSGVVVFDPGDLDVAGDDRWRTINASGNGESPIGVPSNRIFSIAVDQDGAVWAGTEQGVVVFECGNTAFEADLCPGNKPTSEVDGILGFLLETSPITDIEVDGANRKWFGTTSGIFVQSPNGREAVAQFDEQNSPLFNNTITDIAIDPKTGEVWIGTNQGLQSFQSDVIEGDNFHAASATVFPNPVRPEYDGPIVMRGLARNSDVKVTDINGQLVFEGTALGGQAVWNGRDYTGRRVNSGVYLIYATNTNRRDEAQAVVGKILILN